MAFSLTIAFLAALLVIPGSMVFLSKKLINSVIFLALVAAGSALIFIYVSETLVAMLQLLVFVGSLSTYLIVAVASEEKDMMMLSAAKFFICAVTIALVLSYLIYSPVETQLAENSFSKAAELAFSDYAAFIFAFAFLMFAATIGSILIIKKVSILVF
jgi:hypothetical protein